MTRHIFLVLATVTLAWNCIAQQSYTISGEIQNADTGIIFLERKHPSNLEDKFTITDSGKISNGKFILKGTVKFPELFFLRIKGSKLSDRLPFFLENSAIKINGERTNFRNASVSGSKLHSRLSEFNARQNDMLSSIKSFYWPVYSYADATKNDILKNLLDSLRNEVYAGIEKYSKKAILSNLDNPLGPYLAISTFYRESQAAELDTLLKQFSPVIANSVYVLKLKDDLEKWKGIGVGSIINIPDSGLKDTSGNAVAIDMFRGKYLLIDIWASWCLPCRKANPELIKIYNKLNRTEFEILGIAFDEDKNKWKEAINMDKLPWPQATDLLGWFSLIAKKIGINALPYNILIDKTEKIIAKDIHGVELKKKLAEIFKTDL